MGENIEIVVLIVICLIIGLLLINGKCSSLIVIVGYNGMNKEDKNKFDEKALSRFVGLVFIAISLCMMLIPVGRHFEMYWLENISMALTVVLIVFGIIYPKIGNRYRS